MLLLGLIVMVDVTCTSFGHPGEAKGNVYQLLFINGNSYDFIEACFENSFACFYSIFARNKRAQEGVSGDN